MNAIEPAIKSPGRDCIRKRVSRLRVGKTRPTIPVGLVDAGERSVHKTKITQEEGNRVKKANSLRAQEAVARYGAAARYPVCQAALDLWKLDKELCAQTKNVSEAGKLVNGFKHRRTETAALINWAYEAKRGKEAAQAASIMQRLDNELLPKAQKAYEAEEKLWKTIVELQLEARERYEREFAEADKKARRALQQVEKRWSADAPRLKTGDRRELGILAMLRDKKTWATWAIRGPAAGYWEASTGADRPLFDETWQGRLTARGIHSHLAATYGVEVAGDKDAKEVRRACKNLGLRLAEDQRGRKWKPPYLKKQEPKRPRGRPREKPELVTVRNIDGLKKAVTENLQAKAVTARDEFEEMFTEAQHASSGGQYKKPTRSGDTVVKDAPNLWQPASAKKELAKIKREIRALTLRAGGRKGHYVY